MRRKHNRTIANNRGAALAYIFIGLALASLLSSVGYGIFRTIATRIDLQNYYSTKTILNEVKSRLIAQQGDPDGDGYPELLKESGGTLPAALTAPKTDAWGKNLTYCTWDLGTANGNGTYSQNFVAPPISNLIGRVISAGKDKVLQTTCSTATNSSGDDILVDVYSNTQSYIGAVYSAVAPSSPSNGLIWYDTSGGAGAYIAKIWNGSSWVNMGAPTPVNSADVATKAYVDASASAGSAKVPKIQTFTAAGNFTVPSGVYEVWVTGCAGGGGGGGGIDFSGGGGGGAGQIAFKYPLAVTPGNVIAVGIGTAGSGGAGWANGTAGGSTTFGGLLTLAGGYGGTTSIGGNGGGQGVYSSLNTYNPTATYGLGSSNAAFSAGCGPPGINLMMGAAGGGRTYPGGACSYRGGAGSVGGGGAGGFFGSGGDANGGSAPANSCAGGAGGNSGAGSGGNGGTGKLVVEWWE